MLGHVAGLQLQAREVHALLHRLAGREIRVCGRRCRCRCRLDRRRRCRLLCCRRSAHEALAAGLAQLRFPGHGQLAAVVAAHDQLILERPGGDLDPVAALDDPVGVGFTAGENENESAEGEGWRAHHGGRLLARVASYPGVNG